MAVTEASTKELKRWRMSWMRSVFSKATAAWLVRELTSSFHGGEGDDRLLHHRHRAQHHLGVPLLVDELDHADHLVLVVAHGDDQHGARPVAGLLVEGAADLEGEAGGKLVGVGHVDVAAAQGHVAGDGGLVQGHGLLLERDHDGVVLSELEREPRVLGRLLVLAPLHQVEAARIRVRDLPALQQDQLQELLDVALRGEGHSDAVQVVQLLALAGEGAFQLADHAPAVDGVEGPLQAQAQAGPRHGPNQDVVQEGEAAEDLVALSEFRDRDHHRLMAPAGLEPLVEGGSLRLQGGGVGQNQGRGLAVQKGLERGQAADLLGGHPRGEIAHDDIPRFAPDQNARHCPLVSRGPPVWARRVRLG
jgi:hypothetical protein